MAEGQTLDLSCVVAGQAHAQVTWYKRGGSLPARHQVRVGSKVRGGQPGRGQWVAGFLAPELKGWQFPVQRSKEREVPLLSSGKPLSHTPVLMLPRSAAPASTSSRHRQLTQASTFAGPAMVWRPPSQSQ